MKRMTGRASRATGMLSRRGLIGAFGALGVAGLLDRPGHVQAADPATVTVWTWQDSVGVAALKDAASSFNASQRDVRVDVVRRPDVISTFQLLNTIRDGEGPDLCVGSRALLAERDVLGIYKDASAYLSDADPGIDLDGAFLPFVMREVRLGDRLLGVPLETTVRVLAYNRSILANAGVDLAEWDPRSGPVTFDRLTKVAQGLDQMDSAGSYGQIGYLPGFGEGSVYQYLAAWSASYWDDAHCAFTVDTPAASSAVEWNRAYLQHFDGPALEAFFARNGGVSVPAGVPFIKGELAFALVRGEDLRAIVSLAPGITLGATFVPVPAAGAPSRSWATGNALSLMTGAKRPDVAVRFMAYMASVDVLERYCLAIGSLPSRKQVSPEVLAGLAFPTFIADGVLAGAAGTPHVPIATQFGDMLATTWGDMVSGRVDVAAGLSDLQSQADQALNDDAATCP